MAITALTRNQMVGFTRHVGSNPTLSANKTAPSWGHSYWRTGCAFAPTGFDKRALLAKDADRGAVGGPERT